MSHYFYITPDEYERAASNGISARTLEERVRKRGWDKERAITQVVRKQTNFPKWVNDTAKKNGIPRNTLLNRICTLKWDMERACTQAVATAEDRSVTVIKNTRKYPKELEELAKQNGISTRIFSKRAKDGWDLYDAATTPIMSRQEIAKMGKEAYKEIHGRFIYGKEYNQIMNHQTGCK